MNYRNILNKNSIIQKFILILLIIIVIPIISVFLYRDSSSFSNLNNKLISSSNVTVNINNNFFILQIANTPETRSKGLMFIEKLDKNKGMLFIFEKTEIQTFWMKNTYIPLDIIFLDENFDIVTIYKNAKPLDTRTLYSSLKPSKYVIEILGGISDQINLTETSKVKIIDYK